MGQTSKSEYIGSVLRSEIVIGIALIFLFGLIGIGFVVYISG